MRILLIILFLVGCARNTHTEKTPSFEDRLMGYWQLDTPVNDDEARAGIAQIMKFSINRNGLHDLDFCSKFSQAATVYQVDGRAVVYPAVLANPSAKMITSSENVRLEITALRAESLVINAKYEYHRLHPDHELEALSKDSPLCSP